jgi:hypothetical protein
VNSLDDQNFRLVFSSLLKHQEPQVGGRTGLSDDLLSDLKRLAGGEVDEKELKSICNKIALSPEALRAFANLLKDSANSTADERTL